MPSSLERYARELLAFRTTLRHFLRWSAQAAAEAGITTAQYQLMLAVAGQPDPRGPNMTDVASYLALEHQSALGLVNRAVAADLVVRRRDEEDRRVVRLRLTPNGHHKLQALIALHRPEVQRIAMEFSTLFEAD